jgi:hypothetical protein
MSPDRDPEGEQTTSARSRKAREERPPPCPLCAHPRCWWNGSRCVHVVIKDGDTAKRCEVTRARSKCVKCRESSTIYEPSEYPHRQYQLDVVADVAAARAIGGATVHDAAARGAAS